ncbi:MAG TPA: hypothetical protein VGD04_02905 [Methylophilus sp.]
MKSTVLIGAILIALGVAGLVFKGFSYKSQETVVKIGPLEATAEVTKDMPIPSILSIIAIVVGGGLVVVGLKK